ncbi:MAG TPA: formylglycine-generating enzyme family protein [Gemmataceae bacterium]|jgi:uncharacterized protein (TIGR02996 family)|nr:formylglycine-generating enzyme family protein [Gemmataceae bacterium]
MLGDEPFLQAIRADPADEAPWLTYADWLEERGDPRAALYRHRRLTNSIGIQLVLVPRGTFWMGRPSRETQIEKCSAVPFTQAEIPHDFYIGAFPITQEQWQTVMGNNPSWFSRSGGGADAVEGISDADLQQFPVESVSWEDVQEFLKRLNAREKDGGFLYRLPNQAEWEYSCRGGAFSQEECGFDFYFSRPTNDLSSEQANFNGNFPAGNAPKGKYLGRTSQVGSYQPNRLGIHDLHGNVWEWCADHIEGDWWGSGHVARGGGWSGYAANCRASYRFGSEPADRRDWLGFRLVAVPSGE